MKKVLTSRAFVGTVSAAVVAMASQAFAETLPPFGEVALVDEVDCTKSDHRFEEYPVGGSRVEEILGKGCRVMPVQGDKSSFMKWRLGEGKGLKPLGAYVVVVEYPDDVPRDYLIRNNGNNSRRSFYTGAGIGDAWEAQFVNHHPESLKIPQSGKYEKWKSLTFLGQKASTLGEKGMSDIATEGFDFVVAQYKRQHYPESKGIAVSRVAIYEILDEKAAWAKIVFPPSPLPRRRIFWREEMSDGDMNEGGICGSNGGLDWIEQKFRTMKILGQNTYCKDLLEFGHNQHWDPNWKSGQPGAKNPQWMWASNGSNADVWSRAVPMAVDKYGFDILPYYEYGGASGNSQVAGSLGPQKRAEPLDIDNKPDRETRGANYTHIWWSDGKLRVDITDPDTIEELKYILDGTILRFKDQVGKGGFAGVLMRPRPGQWPISFSDKTRARFAEDANGGKMVSRQDIKNDRALYDRYLQWFGKRRADFMNQIRQYLEDSGVKNAIAILDSESSEPGKGIADRSGIYTDDPETWKSIMPGKGVVDLGDPGILSGHLYLKALKSPAYNWGPWEWHHADPMSDPDKYSNLKNVWLAMPFNRLFSVSDPYCLSAYRNGDGTGTLIRHYGLNEHMVEDKLIGYAIADFERAGRACMIAEVNAMANGDPVNLGYLMGSEYTRGFPEPVREFNQNFLALPAMPSKVVPNACDDPEVTLRVIDAGRYGKYYILVHTGFHPKKNVVVRLPGAKEAKAIVSGKVIPLKKGAVTVNLKPWQLVSILAR